MYDEQIRKVSKRLNVSQLFFTHPIEKQLLGLFEPTASVPTSVILTGTAGDGKSNLCGKVWHQLGGDAAEWDSPEIYFQITASIGGRQILVHMVRDLTGLPPTDDRGRYASKDELLQRLSSILFSSEPNEIFVLAANDGQLIETWRRLPPSEHVLQARAVFDKLLDENRDKVEGLALGFFHLSRLPSLTLLDLALNAFLAHPGWQACYAEADEAGFFGPRCPVRHNYELLLQPLVQKRLRSLMRLCDHSDLHIPIRRLLLLLTNAVLGHPDVKDWLLKPGDVAKVINDGTVAKASLFSNIFGGNLSDSRRDSLEVFDYLNRFRIGYETSNRVDNILIFGDADDNLKPYFDELMAADTFYGADASYYAAQRSYVEGGEDGDRAAEGFLALLVSQRRGLFFKIPAQLEDELKLWELTVFKYAGEYLTKVVDVLHGGGKVERPILARLVKGLNRVFVGMLVDVDRDLLLATSLSFSGPSVGQLLEDRIPVAARKDERIELTLLLGRPAIRVQLSEALAATLRLNLTRFEFLSRVAEGALPGSFSRECYEDFLAFKSQVLASLATRRAHEKSEDAGLSFKLLSVDQVGNVTDDVIEVVP
ncbi:MAG: hypothetical protein E6J91_19865 [Deltaproteobacteria bacterium]|nr:MAG: hypothetical protein E6J91_19865 [Deltaproteobacteria bacterium]